MPTFKSFEVVKNTIFIYLLMDALSQMSEPAVQSKLHGVEWNILFSLEHTPAAAGAYRS